MPIKVDQNIEDFYEKYLYLKEELKKDDNPFALVCFIEELGKVSKGDPDIVSDILNGNSKYKPLDTKLFGVEPKDVLLYFVKPKLQPEIDILNQLAQEISEFGWNFDLGIPWFKFCDIDTVFSFDRQEEKVKEIANKYQIELKFNLDLSKKILEICESYFQLYSENPPLKDSEIERYVQIKELAWKYVEKYKNSLRDLCQRYKDSLTDLNQRIAVQDYFENLIKNVENNFKNLIENIENKIVEKASNLVLKEIDFLIGQTEEEAKSKRGLDELQDFFYDLAKRKAESVYIKAEKWEKTKRERDEKKMKRSKYQFEKALANFLYLSKEYSILLEEDMVSIIKPLKEMKNEYTSFIIKDMYRAFYGIPYMD
jgi:hypothetical protein